MYLYMGKFIYIWVNLFIYWNSSIRFTYTCLRAVT